MTPTPSAYVSLFPPREYQPGERPCPACEAHGYMRYGRALGAGRDIQIAYDCLVCGGSRLAVGPREAMTVGPG
ncbi:MAG TPA: hypothetical protein VEJ18_20655 [Planctomycetota bacterium]|nr:hypothetical protein [Planctomycetota bacterium]